MIRTTLRLGAAVALAAAALLPGTASAGTAPCDEHVGLYHVNVPGYADCMVDAGLGTVVRVSTCTQGYDPLVSGPIGTAAVAETQEYADCLV